MEYYAKKRRKKIFKTIINYVCISDIKDINRNYIKCEFEREQLRFKENNPNKEYIYPNQKNTAIQVVKSFFEEKKKAISLIALPQVGKTGTFLYVAYLMTTSNYDDVIEPENIFIITGMSDKEWEIQTKNDMLPQFKNNVYHHGKLDNFKSNFMERHGKKLLIIDESHHGNKTKQKLDKIICEINGILGLQSIINIVDFNCLLLSVSATPGVTLYDLRKIGEENHKEVYIEPSENYVSFELFIEQNRIEKSEKMSINFLQKIKEKIDERYKDNFKYHMFRLNLKYHQMIKKFCDDNNYVYMNHYSGDKKENFDNLIKNKPENHTFIIIKGYYRAGKRLYDKHIGITYEHTPSVNMESTPQGLTGRFCGNDKNNNPIDSPYFYCNLESIKKYISHYNNNCNFTEYSAPALKIKNNIQKKYIPSTMTHFETNKNSNNIMTQIEYNKLTKDIPHVFILDKTTYEKLVNSDNKTDLIKKIIGTNDYLINIINTYKYGGISRPQTDNSYKKHIVDTYNAKLTDKPFIIDIHDKFRYDNVWMAFIDNHEFIDKYFDDNKLKLIITVYHGKKKYEIDNKNKNI